MLSFEFKSTHSRKGSNWILSNSTRTVGFLNLLRWSLELFCIVKGEIFFTRNCFVLFFLVRSNCEKKACQPRWISSLSTFFYSHDQIKSWKTNLSLKESLIAMHNDNYAYRVKPLPSRLKGGGGGGKIMSSRHRASRGYSELLCCQIIRTANVYAVCGRQEYKHISKTTLFFSIFDFRS